MRSVRNHASGLRAATLDDVQNLVVVIVALVVIGQRALPHLRIKRVQFEQRVIESLIERQRVQPYALSFFERDRV